MNDFQKIDLSKFQDIKIGNSQLVSSLQNIRTSENAMMQVIKTKNEHEAKKDKALFQIAEFSEQQKELLIEQLNGVRKQNDLLEQNYTTLKQLYDTTRSEADGNAKEAKKSRVFGWISLGVGSLIGIVGIVLGIIY